MSLKFITKLLILLICILLFEGCVKRIYVYPPVPQCFIPERPKLETISSSMDNLHLIKTVLFNLNKTTAYSYELETSIECYRLYFNELEKIKKKKENKK